MAEDCIPIFGHELRLLKDAPMLFDLNFRVVYTSVFCH